MRRNYTAEEKAYIDELFREQLTIDINDDRLLSKWNLADNIRIFLGLIYDELAVHNKMDRNDIQHGIVEISICLYNKRIITKHTLGVILREYLNGYHPYLPSLQQDKIEYLMRDPALAESYMGKEETKKLNQIKRMGFNRTLYTIFPDYDLGLGGPAVFWTNFPEGIIWRSKNPNHLFWRIEDAINEMKNAPYFRYMREDIEKQQGFREREFSSDEILAVQDNLYIVKNHIDYIDYDD